MNMLIFLEVPFSSTLIHEVLQVVEDGFAFLIILSAFCIDLTSNVRFRLKHDFVTCHLHIEHIEVNVSWHWAAVPSSKVQVVPRTNSPLSLWVVAFPTLHTMSPHVSKLSCHRMMVFMLFVASKFILCTRRRSCFVHGRLNTLWYMVYIRVLHWIATQFRSWLEELSPDAGMSERSW